MEPNVRTAERVRDILATVACVRGRAWPGGLIGVEDVGLTTGGGDWFSTGIPILPTR